MNGNENSSPFPGKIAVITSPAFTSGDDYHSATQLIAKYGTDKVIHHSWQSDLAARQEDMLNIVARVAEDREIKALIFNQAFSGTNTVVDKLKETRDDIFIIYCLAHDPTAEAAARANLMLRPNELGMGKAMVKQAKKQGARVFVHYSFPRHMEQPTLSGKRDMIRDTCAAEGIQFVDAAALDYHGEAGIDGAQQFILDDVHRMVAKYGEDTAFFCTNCNLQISLIKAIVESHAIYPQPCCPSPYHGFPQAFGIDTGKGLIDLNFLIDEISSIAAEKNMTDRLSTWPVSASMMHTNAGAEYAIKWINGEVPRKRIDDRALEDCMSAYVKEFVGEGVEVTMESYSEGGNTFDNFKLLLMSYLDF